MSKADKKKSRAKTQRQANAPLAIAFSNDIIEAQVGQRYSRNEFGSERAIEYGKIRSERLVQQGLKTTLTEIGARGERSALSIPTELFKFHQGTIAKVSDLKVDPIEMVENNLGSIYLLQPGEYGQFAINLIEQDNELRVTYVTAEAQALTNYVKACAAQSKPVAIEPRLISEMRAIIKDHPDNALVLYGEMGATYLVNLQRGEIFNLQEVGELEQAMIQIGRGEGFVSGARIIYQGQDHAMLGEGINRLIETIDEEISYSDMLGLHFSEKPLLLAGDLDLENGAETFTQLTGMHFVSASDNTPGLATRGVLMRNQPELARGTLSINLLNRSMLPQQSSGASALAGYVAPIVILLVSGGLYLAQNATLAAQQQRKSQLEAQLAALEPQVAQQLELQNRNTEINQEVMRADQIRSARSYWPEYLELIANRVPDTTLIGITSLTGKQDREVNSREFDGRKVDIVFQVDVQAKTREAMSSFIQAFNTSPFSISVTNYTSGEGRSSGARFMTARIGLNSEEVNPVLARSAASAGTDDKPAASIPLAPVR